MSREVEIFCDGSGNTAATPCGFAAILRCNGHEKEVSGARVSGTNNVAELMAAIIGIEALKGKCTVRVYSDSEYLVKSMAHGHVRRWESNHWTKRVIHADTLKNHPEIVEGMRVANADLWERLLDACAPHKVTWHWVRGHNGHAENERADKLAKAARANYLDYIL